jgi:hypothetical protein
VPECILLQLVLVCHTHMLCACLESEAIIKAERHGDSDDDIRELQERSTRALQGSGDVNEVVPAACSKAGDESQQVKRGDSH